ncbi:alanyl-tRNA editing protein [Butyrivibrio sp. YAB3001]|uniref:alanyl-tRNA editing protein n=1 Tax=Butyrivibrio sp. YAB3001 TaxID=1520812 RepID=UPI0008F67353|nr:alanyl-tRNA editing protein [Butyrivibrio sp. YAB3001]SFC80739.1 alanyl-tRNA synthetase [Butyrivibrio sp. YAB3001]
MTKELYYDSAYIKEFDAKVLSCEKTDAGYEIVLDETAFFPEQGGQGSDIGVLVYGADETKAQVSHVSIGADIKHCSDIEIPVGTKVHGVIDWERRFGNMQQHTGEHIFSGIVNSMYGANNVGFHLSDSEVTMDYDKALTREQISDIEMRVNQAIWENIRVSADFPSEKELENIDYRSKKELTGRIRLVTIDGYDVCACCAPHVEKTGEIGLLKVVGLQNYKGGVRVNILCGKRALEFLNEQQRIVSDLSGKFTTSSDKVEAAINKVLQENADIKGKLASLNEALIEYELKEIDSSLENVILVKDGIDNNSMRKLVNSLCAEHAGVCGVLCGNKADGYRFILGSGSLNKDLKQVVNVLREKFGAKGGGSANMVQGSLFADDIESVKETVVSAVK